MAPFREKNAEAAPPLAGIGFGENVPDLPGKVAESAEPRLPYGHVLDDRFLIREVAGRSGAATIYRAEDLGDHRREVAVKVPHGGVEGDPAGFVRFCNEERILAALDHPFLLRLVPVDFEKSRPYFVTEFLRGSTLDCAVSGRTPVPEADAFRFGSLLCGALAALHGAGFVHRDLKPENIMICCDGTLRVMDFGLASKPVPRRPLAGMFLTPFGTPQYMAPEQVKQGAIDERTDVYCLGAILYELLTGSTPLQDKEDPWASAYRRMTGDPVAPRKLNPNLSPQAEEIVLHALARKASDRPATMTAFQADLDTPSAVTVTNRASRLRPPRFRLSFQATPVLAGALCGFSVMATLAAILLLVCHFHPPVRHFR